MIKTKIPYYPELRDLIPTLGFNSSSKVFSYLKKCGVGFIYDRFTGDEDQIPLYISKFNDWIPEDDSDKGFIFAMDASETDKIDVVHCLRLSKDDMIKYLKLKVFS